MKVSDNKIMSSIDKPLKHEGLSIENTIFFSKNPLKNQVTIVQVEFSKFKNEKNTQNE